MKTFEEAKSTTKVFLGGTCNDSLWREKLIPMLSIDYIKLRYNERDQR